MSRRPEIKASGPRRHSTPSLLSEHGVLPAGVAKDGVPVFRFEADPVLMPDGYGTRPAATAEDYNDKPFNPKNRSRRSAGLFNF